MLPQGKANQNRTFSFSLSYGRIYFSLVRENWDGSRKRKSPRSGRGRERERKGMRTNPKQMSTAKLALSLSFSYQCYHHPCCCCPFQRLAFYFFSSSKLPETPLFGLGRLSSFLTLHRAIFLVICCSTCPDFAREMNHFFQSLCVVALRKA